MKSPLRALGYGLGVWVGLVVVSLLLLPAEKEYEALYESIKQAGLVALALGFSIRYLSRRPTTSSAEGASVGLLWAAIAIALDLGLYLAGAFTIGLSSYFTDVASSYLVIPIITTLVMGRLRARAEPIA